MLPRSLLPSPAWQPVDTAPNCHAAQARAHDVCTLLACPRHEHCCATALLLSVQRSHEIRINTFFSKADSRLTMSLLPLCLGPKVRTSVFERPLVLGIGGRLKNCWLSGTARHSLALGSTYSPNHQVILYTERFSCLSLCDCSDCFRLQRQLPSGIRTHGKTAPLHDAQQLPLAISFYRQSDWQNQCARFGPQSPSQGRAFHSAECYDSSTICLTPMLSNI